MLRHFRLTFPARPASTELVYIDVVRFVAACGIVFLHSKQFLDVTPSVSRVLKNADGFAIFVDVFFVISGYVITYVYHDRISSLPLYFVFLQRRIARLVPLHWAMLLVFVLTGVAITALHIPMNHAGRFDNSCILTELFLVNAEHLCSQLSFNGVSWSIGAEFAMYIAFPIILVLVKRSRGIALLSIAAVLSFLFWGPFDPDFGNLTWDFGALRAFPSFALGVLLFNCRDTLATIPSPSGLTWAALGAFVIAVLLNADPRLLVLIGYLLCLFTVAADAQRSQPSRIIHFLGAAGQLTYSLYMVHLFIITLIPNFIGDKVLHLHGIAANALLLTTYIVIFGLSYCSFVFFETPARRWVSSLRLSTGTTAAPQSSP